MLELLSKILVFERLSPTDRDLISRAFDVASQAHTDQKRRSGEPYITHPLSVAYFLANMGLDAATIAASLLHDIVEDTDVSLVDIEKQFGSEVSFLVDGVTKLKAVAIRHEQNPTKSTLQIESLKKMFFAMAQDIRVILIKLADRYNNLLTLKHLDAEARERISRETLEIYAPIAGRLGMGNLKGQLEDLAFPFVYPAAYKELIKNFTSNYEKRLAYVETTKPIIEQLLSKSGIKVIDIHSRVKRYYSLYQKIQKYNSDITKIFDLVAIRILVADVSTCYEALGIIHARYKPLPGKIKDFIAIPKPNGYQSLHTTVFCEKGQMVEIQIRTPDMHEHAENGIAAHWAYSESGKREGFLANKDQVQWIEQLKSILADIKTKEGLQNVKIDFFRNRIFAFTPQGEIKDLPEGATPIDFAYAVHTNLGHATGGAKVGGSIVPLTYELQNGDVVEIIKNKNGKPSFDWLKIIKTTHARQSINSWFKSNDPRVAIMNGKALVDKLLRQIGTSFEKLNREQLNILFERYSVKTADALLTRISVGDVEPADMVKTLFPDALRASNTKPRKKTESKSINYKPKTVSSLIIDGQHDILYKLGRCCNPSHGENVQGYVTRTKGVTVHLISCRNIKDADTQRLLPASWN